MQNGGDTRDLSLTPLLVFTGPIKVRPGQSGEVSFTITNRYNQSVEAVRVAFEFQVGGSWLEARRLAANATDVPRFSGAMPTPFAIASNASHTVVLPFTTTPATPAGVYLASMTMAFQYVNATGVLVDARFVSLGSLDPSERSHVNLDNQTETLNALNLDGVVPDTSITVDNGEAMGLWLSAAAFGVVVVGIGAAYGFLKGRRHPQGRR